MILIACSYHCCIRVLKETIPLMRRGIPVYYFQNSIANEEALYALPFSTGFYSTKEQYVRKLDVLLKSLRTLPKEMGPPVIHVHNEPDWLVHLAKKIAPDIPVIYDCHDLNSQRGLEPTEDEVTAMAVADAYVFPSKSYLEGTTSYHHLPPEKPSTVIYSMALEETIVEKSLPRLRGIVYQGGIIAPEKEKKPPETFPWYRDYRLFAQACLEMEIPFAVYGMEQRYFDSYHELGVLANNAYPYVPMLQELSRWDWGLVGCPVSHPQWEKAMPNKLFEYLAAGIPVIVYNAAECAEFVREHGVGIVIEEPEQLREMYDDHQYLREIVAEKRYEFTMETQVDKLLGFYQDVISSFYRVK